MRVCADAAAAAMVGRMQTWPGPLRLFFARLTFIDQRAREQWSIIGHISIGQLCIVLIINYK